MIKDFISEYYINPVIYGQGYNIVNTITYATILVVCVYLLYRLFSEIGISIDRQFIYALLPWVVFGGLLRVVEDCDILAPPFNYILITPLIYFFIFTVVFSILIISFYLERKRVISSWKRTFGYSGASALIPLAVLLWFGYTHSTVDLTCVALILGMTASTTGLIYAALRYVFKWTYMSERLYQLLIAGHMLDASATSYGIDIHPVTYFEQHVVGGALIEATGTAFSMFPLKLIVLIPGIYILELYRTEGSKPLWYLILLAMIVVGMAPGIRDMTRMMLHV
jgi:uncharacterized membrane protein